MSIVTFVLFIVLPVFVFLMWIEAIPLRKWYYIFRIKIIGIKSRFLVEILDFLDRTEKWIDSL